MKIALANSSFGGGGITTYAHELVNALSDKHDVYLIIGDDSKFPISNDRLKVYNYDCELHTVDNARKVIDLINNEIQPDLLIASGATLIPLISPFLKDDLKVVTISHSARYMHSDYCALNHQYIDRIVAASSEYNKQYLERKFKIKDKNKIKVIVNFVEDRDDAEEYVKSKQHRKGVKIVFAGGCQPPKTPELVVRIVNALIKTDWDFKFYWTGNTILPLVHYLPFIKLKYAKQLIPEDRRVVFTGRIPEKDDLDKLVADCDIFLAPSRREGCSMALIEALRDGCIPIVADFKNSNRILTVDNVNGFIINRNDVKGFVSKIGDIINDNEKYINFYSNARNYYLSNLVYEEWEKKISKYVVEAPLFHSRRKNNINSVVLRYQFLKFQILSIFDKVMMLFDESLRVFISLLIQNKKIIRFYYD